MNKPNTTPINSLLNRQSKDKQIKLLRKYLLENKYLDIQEQPKICKQFGLQYQRELFRSVYRERFYHYLLENVTTVATVERVTGIPQKYLTVCKLYYQKLGLLKVVGFGICPTTKSKNVQFVSTNPKHIEATSLESIVINKQLNLFD